MEFLELNEDNRDIVKEMLDLPDEPVCDLCGEIAKWDKLTLFPTDGVSELGKNADDTIVVCGTLCMIEYMTSKGITQDKLECTLKCTPKNVEDFIEVFDREQEDCNGRGAFDIESDLRGAVNTIVDWMEEHAKDEKIAEQTKTKEWTCPRCKQTTTDYPALSRRDNLTHICNKCGTSEALKDFAKNYGQSD